VWPVRMSQVHSILAASEASTTQRHDVVVLVHVPALSQHDSVEENLNLAFVVPFSSL